jgi:hypothetical protein
MAQATLETFAGRAVCATADGAVAGAYDYRHPGHLLLLPALQPAADGAVRHGVLTALRRLAARLRRAPVWEHAWPWAEAWRLPEEETLAARAVALAARRRALDAELAEVRVALDRLALVKGLVTGDPASAGRAAAVVLHALGAYAQANAGEDGVVAFEHAGTFGVLLPAWGPSPDVIPRALDHAGALGRDARATVLYCDNEQPPAERRGPPPTLLAAAHAAGVGLITAELLLDAHRRRDAAVLDQLIAAPGLRR